MRRLIVVLVAAVVLMVLAGGGVYVYFFSGLRTSPQQLGLRSPSPTATASSATSPSSSSADLAGKWTVTSNSVAGYRVKELFAGQSSKHEAVARTSNVSGAMTVTGDATSGYQITAITITVNLTSLHSVDQVVGRNVSQRDGVVSRALSVDQFPTATFAADAMSIPGPVTGSTVSAGVQGNMTIRGLTRTVSATVQSQVAGGKVEVAGSVTIEMSQFGVTPPTAPFVTVDSQVVIEFDIFLTK